MKKKKRKRLVNELFEAFADLVATERAVNVNKILPKKCGRRVRVQELR